MFLTETVLDVNTNKALVLPMERKISKEYIADIPHKNKPNQQNKTPPKPPTPKLDSAKSLHILDKRLLLTSSQDLLITLQFVNQLTYGTALGKHTIQISHLHGWFATRLLSRFNLCYVT